MSSFLRSLGAASARHPWRVLLGWALVAALVFGLAGTIGSDTQDNWDIPGARAQQGIEQLREHLPGAGNANARVVVHADSADRLDGGALTELAGRLETMPHVAVVLPPRFSADGDTALIEVRYDAPPTHADLMGEIGPLEDAIAATRAAGLQVELGGDVPETAAAPMKGHGELIGLGVALLVLLLAFGSVVGAGLPIAGAIVGLAVGSGGLVILAGLMDVSTVAPTVATMVGLGVGIDYALLLVTRHVEFLRSGLSPVAAATAATATAGRSIVFASATVLVSLSGLRLTGLPTYDAFCFATGIAVVTVAAASLTVVPALCRVAGTRLLPRRVRRGAVRTGTPLTARWAERVARRPLVWALLGVTVMVTLALPTLDMRTWPQDASTQSTELTTRQAYDLVADEYGAGANGPLTIVVDLERVAASEVRELSDQLVSEPGIVAVSGAVTSPDGAIAVLELEPAFGASDARTRELVRDLRSTLPAGVELTGTTALFADIADMFDKRLWIVIAFVVAMSFLLLTLVFRSVLIPLKAAVMNLLSIGAAYGVLTAVFQWGWGAQLVGVDQAMPVSSWIPILIFAILFGLSMDYEVFLLSRIRERWLAGEDTRTSVTRGLADTGRVITAAAAIMVAVFLGFATEVDVVVKMLAVGMATAILLDATVVRMVLVPATMTLLGHWNWWLPRWIDRLLPTVHLEPIVLERPDASVAPEPREERRPVGV